HHDLRTRFKGAIVIKKVAGGYKVLSEKGKNLGGPYKTKKQAEKRLRQVEFFKHRKGREQPLHACRHLFPSQPNASREGVLMHGFRWFLGLLLFALAACAPASAQQLKLFAGYSYLRPSLTYDQVSECPSACPAVPGSVTRHPNLNGYEFSATFKFLPFVGI